MKSISQFRDAVINLLKLWGSIDEQLKYQKNIPFADVSSELFCQWIDDIHINTSDFQQAFSHDELIALEIFNDVISGIADRTPNQLPSIEEFVKTKEWSVVHYAACEALKKINM